MLKRLLTGIVIIAITVGFFALRFVSAYFFDAFVGLIVLASTYEVCRAFKQNGKLNDIYFVLCYPVLCYLSLVLCVYQELNLFIYFAIIIGLAGLLFLITYLLNLFQKNKINKEMVDNSFIGTKNNYAIKKSLRNLFLMIYPAFVLSILFVVNHLRDFSYFAEISGNLELFVLIMIFVTTIVTDTGAYLIGSGIGGKKLCPKISPKKTISGAIGGVLASVAFSLILYAIFFGITQYATMLKSHNLGIVGFVLFGIFASIYTQCGDIFASLIKRKNGLKDFSNIFPGHGGFMDRVDGMSFNVIFALIFVLIYFV